MGLMKIIGVNRKNEIKEKVVESVEVHMYRWDPFTGYNQSFV